MAKARTRRSAAPASWVGEQRDPQLNGMFESMRDTMQEKLGLSVSIGDESAVDVVGLPLPALCLRYLFQSTVFPLSRIIQITGEEGSCKSSFLYELYRWHMVYGGGAVLAENENKDSPELRNSILEWNPTWLSRFELVPTCSLQEWQKVMSSFVDHMKMIQDSPDGPGRTVPVCFSVDSIMATATEEELAQIKKEGFATRGFAVAALLIAKYMRNMPKLIKGYPFTIAGTNHLKPSTDARGLPSSSVPGGKAVKFMETFEIEMKRAHGKYDIDTLEYGGMRLKFTARKNSLGPSRKSITAELLWWYTDDGTGKWRQRTAWDWNTATIELLESFGAEGSGKKTVYNILKDITGIVVVSRGQRTAYSEKLGIPKSDPQLWRIVAAELEKRPDMLVEVYKVLGVTQRAAFDPGVDYAVLQQEAQARAAQAGRNLYEAVSELPTVDESIVGNMQTGLPEDHSPDPEYYQIDESDLGDD